MWAVRKGRISSEGTDQAVPLGSRAGFNPVWDAPFGFRVKAPELAMLHLAVWDRDNGVDDDFIAAAAIPIATLRYSSDYRALLLVACVQAVHPV